MANVRRTGEWDWRDQIRLEIQAEIERQVREALDTPPLERLRRRTEKAKQRLNQASVVEVVLPGPKVRLKRRQRKKGGGARVSWAELDETRQYSPRTDRAENVTTALDDSDSRQHVWETHHQLNAHVESVITDARRNGKYPRKLFHYRPEPEAESHRDWRNTPRNEDSSAHDLERIPTKYKMLIESVTSHSRVHANQDAADDGDSSDNEQESGSLSDRPTACKIHPPPHCYHPQVRKTSSVNVPHAHPALSYEVPLRVGKEALENFSQLSSKEKLLFFTNFTNEAFQSIERSGKLPDGSPVETIVVSAGKHKAFKDQYGLVRDQYGPFWPKEYGPLHPAPVHRRLENTNKLVAEPLSTATPNVNDQSNANDDVLWTTAVIVYDSEKSSRESRAADNASAGAKSASGEKPFIPALSFESRFECGNLRQARRIGERTYELVVNCDLNTNRHTQWYYFRVRNALHGVTYRFIFVNFMKPTSLYNQGMQPLVYSERRARQDQVGWYRCGHHISYSRNVDHRECPLLRFCHDELYQLDVCFEFPFDNDTCYVAHCYPYGFTDLKNDLELLLAERSRASCVKRSVLCETLIGNACFLLTITNFNSGIDITAAPDATESELAELKVKNKKVVVITARVHPGETNSSWMMKGLIEYLSSDNAVARRLRDSVIFKIVPMLNPDGVIVGNYRCSLTGRDLNRNYRQPKQQRFPTVWYTKEMLRQLARDHQVLLYCDLHGHSRQSSSFLYGCDSAHLREGDFNFEARRSRQGTPECYLDERLFSWLMAAQSGNELFSFPSCKYGIRRCKESTGRVVMWRQLGIECSYTLEVSFCGTRASKPAARHFHTTDLEAIGAKLAQTVDEYTKVRADTVLLHNVYSQMMTYLINSSPLSLTDKQRSDIGDSNNSSGPIHAINRLSDQFKLWLARRTTVDDDSDLDSNSDAEREMLSDPESPPASPPAECSDSHDLNASKPLPKKSVKHSKKTKRTSLAASNAHNASQQKSSVASQHASQGTPKSKRAGAEKMSDQTNLGRTSRQSVTVVPPPQHNVKAEEVSAKKFINPYQRASNGGIPCFALRRALEKTEIKLEQLRSKFEGDSEKMEALELEYSKQIVQLQKRLNELTNMPPALSSGLTIVLDDDEDLDQEPRDDQNTTERQVSLRSILFEPQAMLTELKPPTAPLNAATRTFKPRSIQLSNSNNAISRLAQQQTWNVNTSTSTNTNVSELMRSHRIGKSNAPDESTDTSNNYLRYALAKNSVASAKNGYSSSRHHEQFPAVSSACSLEPRELLDEFAFAEYRNAEALSIHRHGLRYDSQPTSNTQHKHFENRLLQLRSQDRDSNTRANGHTREAERIYFDQRCIAPQTAPMQLLPGVIPTSANVRYRVRRSRATDRHEAE